MEDIGPRPVGRVSPVFYDLLTIVGAAFFVGLLLVLWAAYIRRPRRRSSDSRRELPAVPAVIREVEDVDGKKRLKIKERKRDHRPRNPTLAETGGLPPERPSDSSHPPR